MNASDVLIKVFKPEHERMKYSSPFTMYEYLATGIVQNILLEFNTSGEESKFGIRSEDELQKIAEYCVELKNIKLLGLMTMAPLTEDENAIRKSFSKLKATFDSMNNKGFGLTELSMGMTNDFEIAVEEGSTILRIGTAIFGERDYSKPWDAK